MFCDMADALPFYTWHTLFGALGRLSRRECIELIAHRWDYEIIFLPKAGMARFPSNRHSHQQRQNERPH
jgi:hypothetical protein